MLSDPSAAERVYENITHSEDEQLLQVLTTDHSIVLNLVPGNNVKYNDPEYVYFEVFNSGDGLEHHGLNKVKARTMLVIKIKKELIDKKLIQHCLSRQVMKTEEFYQMLLKDGTKVEVKSPRWQTIQKTGNCNLECWFAFLANKMLPLQYHKMRLAFFEACCAEAVDHPTSPRNAARFT